jgi:outer membrane protein OmpA-like peptidoglycan-associated protein
MTLHRFLVSGVLIGWGLYACKSAPKPLTTTTVRSSTQAITKLEPPTMIAPTRFEIQSSTQTTTTTVTVQRALTDLQAQKTSEGIRINLPENILFDFDRSDLRSNAKLTLQKVSVLINNYAKAPVAINGHTDSKGSDDYNQELSNRRAEAVKTYLTQNFKVDADRLETKGFGSQKPIAPNTNPDGSDNPDGRQKNRRVEVIIRNQS